MPFERVSIRERPNHYVTGHFMYSDFICPCCDLVPVTPGFYRHVELLERIRNELGFAIAVNSGYRCRSHNRKVGGASRSWHLVFATDVRPEDGSPERLEALYDHAAAAGFGGIGRYGTFIHLDLRPEPCRWKG